MSQGAPQNITVFQIFIWNQTLLKTHSNGNHIDDAIMLLEKINNNCALLAFQSY